MKVATREYLEKTTDPLPLEIRKIQKLEYIVGAPPSP